MKSATPLLAGTLALSSCAALAAPYSAKGEEPASSHIKHARYSFDVVAPSSVYKDIAWKRFSDDAEPLTTVLVTGMQGYDSYALSVMPERGPEATPVEIGKRKFPDTSFTPVGEDCAISDLAKPIELDGRMVAFEGFCIEPKSHQAYELTISWKSLLLAVDEIDPEGKQCGVGVRWDPIDKKCEDTMGDMRAAMNTFVHSFRFRG